MPEARPYQRVLALIDFDSTDERIARKALLLARLNRAQLAFLHLIEPDAALDGGYPASGPKADAAALETAALRRLNFMSAQLGAGEAECIAQFGPAHQAFKRKLQEWQPDLVVSAKDAHYLTGLHDLLILGQASRVGAGKTFKRLASWLSAKLQPASF